MDLFHQIKAEFFWISIIFKRLISNIRTLPTQINYEIQNKIK